MNAHIDGPADRITDFCKRWQILELALFGSVLRDDFGPESDVDVLVRFDPQARHTLFDLAQMQDDLSALLARKVDLIERVAVERSPNYIRRKAILQSAETIYAA
jgi:predicted nucleotidyltransferase